MTAGGNEHAWILLRHGFPASEIWIDKDPQQIYRYIHALIIYTYIYIYSKNRYTWLQRMFWQDAYALEVVHVVYQHFTIYTPQHTAIHHQESVVVVSRIVSSSFCFNFVVVSVSTKYSAILELYFHCLPFSHSKPSPTGSGWIQL